MSVEAEPAAEPPVAGGRAMLPQKLSLLGSVDWAVLAACACLGVNIFDFTLVPSYTPRLAALVLLLPVGTLRLAQGVRRHDRVAQVAVLLVAWAAIAAIVNDGAVLSLLGVLGRESSALITAGVVATWAAARSMSEHGRQAFWWLVACMLGVNAAAGLFQILAEPTDGVLALYDGRATGFLTAHVYYGAAMAAGATWVAGSRMAWKWALPSVLLLAACVNLSGSRFPVVIGLAGVLFAAAMYRTPRLQNLAFFAGAYLAGVLGSRALVGLRGGVSATDRAIEAGGAGRLTAWRYGLEAVVERPLAGWGPGRFRESVQGRFSAQFTSSHAADDLTAIWFDAHNIVVQLAVTTGVVGLALAVWFLVLEARMLRGVLGVMLVVWSLPWLLEPAGLASLPLAMAMLGALPSRDRGAVSDANEQADVAPRLVTLLVLLGAVGALLVIVPDARLRGAVDSGAPNRVASAASLYPLDPVVANIAAATFESTRDLENSTVWAQRAVDRQPDRPYLWVRLAALLYAQGDLDGATDAIDEALLLQPWNVDALELGSAIAVARGDDDADELWAKFCVVSPTPCLQSAA